MAGRGVRIPIVAEVSDWLRGTKRVTDSLDDISDEFRDVTRAGQKSADDVADAFRDAARKTDRAFKDVDTHEGFAAIGEEAADTSREVAASFSGSADDIAGGFQELAANAGAAFGPIGLAAGAVGAVAVNALVGAFTQAKEQLAQITGDLFDEMVNNAGKVGEEFRRQKVMDALVSDGDANKAIQQIQRVAGPQGFAMLEQALSGNTAAADALIRMLSSDQAGKWLGRNEQAITWIQQYAQGWQTAQKNAQAYFQYVDQQLLHTHAVSPQQLAEDKLNRARA